mmetsp:Transcript_92/g.103  ORF Transcript_92/g.103 Transcript_92/m.103 type:complete len:568 (-) Transcript_92:262-1965(-)
MPILELRAEPVLEGRHYRFDVYNFKKWNANESQWEEFTKCPNSDDLVKTRNNGNDLFHELLADDTYSEIRLRPLAFEMNKKGIDTNISIQCQRELALDKIKTLIEKKATGMALYRQFWYRCGLKWEGVCTVCSIHNNLRKTCANYRTRLVWQYDQLDKKCYTSFEYRYWHSSDDIVQDKIDGSFKTSDDYRPNFTPEDGGSQLYHLTGLNLAGLTLRTKTNFPATLDCSVLYRCVLDGVNEGTTFRGAYLKNARFCGNSNLSNCNLTSTYCQELHFDFPATTVDNTGIFGGIILDEASLFEEAKFTFEESVAIPKFPNAYKIEGCFGWLKYSNKSRTTLLKHKHELSYVVDELERLRRYEIKRDNWQEVVASWITFQKIGFETYEATTMQSDLFSNPDFKQILIAGNMLYAMTGDLPDGLLKKIKNHLGRTILRKKEYFKEKQKLMAAIATINTILEGKDWVGDNIKNMFLAFYIFISTIFSNLASDRIKKHINKVIDVNTTTTILVGSSNEIPQDSHIPFSAMLGLLGLALVATYKIVKDNRHRYHPPHPLSKQYNKLEYDSFMEA